MDAKRTYVFNKLKYHRVLMSYKQKDIAVLLSLKGTAQISVWEHGLELPNTRNFLMLCLIYRSFPHELYPDLILSLSEELQEIQQYLSNQLS